MDDNNWSRLNKLGCATYFLLLAGFLFGLFYWAIATEEASILIEFNIFYFTLTMLGILYLSDIYFNIVEFIFYPETSSEKLIRNKRRKYRKMYPIEIARLKIKQLKMKLKIKDMNNELKNIKDKITQEEKK